MNLNFISPAAVSSVHLKQSCQRVQIAVLLSLPGATYITLLPMEAQKFH